MSADGSSCIAMAPRSDFFGVLDDYGMWYGHQRGSGHRASLVQICSLDYTVLNSRRRFGYQFPDHALSCTIGPRSPSPHTLGVGNWKARSSMICKAPACSRARDQGENDIF